MATGTLCRSLQEEAMAFSPIKTNGGRSLHQDGHTLGDFSKRTSIGDGKRKRGTYKRKKRYRGQGRG